VSSIIKRESVQLSAGSDLASARTGRSAQRDDRVSVRLLSIDGDVRAIEVGCPCGREHVLELQYEATSPSQKAKA
jgi:hypothetical protein